MNTLKLTPVPKNYLWGGTRLFSLFGRTADFDKLAESWELSVHPDGVCKADGEPLDAYLRRVPGALPPDTELPVLIKYIDAADKLSVQVHPDEPYAREHEGDHGKTEMWYIVRAEEGAGIYCGFSRETTKEEFCRALEEERVESLLNFIPVHAGEAYLIKAGTVHAIGAGCTILEIQQSSNVTYRVYDYGRRDKNGELRPLHVRKALDVINFHAFRDATGSGTPEAVNGGTMRLLTDCGLFRCRELKLDGVFSETAENTFAAVCVVDGEGKADGRPFGRGDSFFVPWKSSFRLEGRATVVLVDVPPREFYAGIDLGGTFVKCALFDHAGNLLAKRSIPTAGEYSAVVSGIADTVKAMAEEAKIPLSELRAVGMGAPGTVSEKGEILYSNNLGWRNVPFGSDLAGQLKKPVFVTNDANAAALGESKFGAGRAYASMILVTLGTGVGGGIVIDGKLFEGSHAAGAEIGHHVICAGGRQCTCGRRGCMEAYASATALIYDTKQAMRRHPESLLWSIAPDLAAVDGKTVFDAAARGDATARRVLIRYEQMLSEGLVNLANIFRPEAILLGGGISKAGETLLAPLRILLSRDIYGGEEQAPVRLEIATLGNDAGVYGALAYAMARAGERPDPSKT